MNRLRSCLCLVFLAGACAAPGGPASSPKAPASPLAGRSAPLPTPEATGRVKAVAADHALYPRVEGTRLKNACAGDSECSASGCSREVCSAEPVVITPCDVQPWPQGDARCGCVAGECVWYRAAVPAGKHSGGAGQGMPCEEGRCAAGLTCVTYYGIAGPGGPRFQSCEIPCTLPDAKCPKGQSCITIADGPGPVCRPQT